jgi:hypothetical protein
VPVAGLASRDQPVDPGQIEVVERAERNHSAGPPPLGVLRMYARHYGSSGPERESTASLV